MLMTKSYIADHWSILRVKKDHGLPVDEELDIFEKEIQDVPVKMLSELYRINGEMFPIHDLIVDSNDLEKLGRWTKDLLRLNAERVRVRSEVGKVFGDFLEYKTYER